MRVIRSCGKYLKRHCLLLIVYSALAVAVKAVGIAAPYITGGFINGLIASEGMDFVYGYCLLLAGLTLLSLVLGYIITRLYIHLQMAMGAGYNLDVLKHLQSVPLSCLEGQDLVRLNQQINTDTNGLIIFCLGLANSLPSNIVSLVLMLIICIGINPLISSLFSLYCILYILIYTLSRKKKFRTSYAQLEAQNRFFSALFEQLSHIGFIRAQGVEEYFRSRTAGPYRALYRSTVESQRFGWLLGGIDTLLSLLCQLTLYITGAAQIMDGAFTIGGFIIFSAYFSMVLSSIRYFYSLGSTYQEALVSHERLKRLEAIPEESAGDAEPERMGSIRIEGLSFSYGEHVIFDDLSETFEKGAIYAIAGPNGSGKTTLTRILLGLYTEDITCGTLKAGGMRLDKMRRTSYRRRSVAYAEQEPVLFSGSLRENIMLGDADSDRWARAQELLRHFGVDWLLCSPSGADGDLPEGLSGGEKQKLSLVRALSKNADIVLLDEPTAALDARSSKALFEYLKSISADKIIILITHDGGMMDLCDHVLRLDAPISGTS